MKMKKSILSILLLTFVLSVQAQITPIKPLSVGDIMPALVIDSVMAFNKSSIKMSDYKNKLVILDFWATWCHWCIEAFPKNDSLQKQFGDKLLIMLVDCKDTDDTKQKITEFYKKRKAAGKEVHLPTIYSDTVLEQLFPHKLIPHYVWIKDGIIKAITDSDQVTAVNIQKMLKGEAVALNLKPE
jgi:thiol-disulfide isomerase/thioredoxin